MGVVTPESVLRARVLVLRTSAGLSCEQIARRVRVPCARVDAWLRRPPSYPLRACACCSELFVPVTRRQRFCCPQHRAQSSRGPVVERVCELCGEPFAPVRGTQRFCCRAHRDEHARRRRLGGERACRLGGERFVVRVPRQRFCSPVHEQAYARRPRTTAGWRAHVDALEAELARLRAQLDRRAERAA